MSVSILESLQLFWSIYRMEVILVLVCGKRKIGMCKASGEVLKPKKADQGNAAGAQHSYKVLIGIRRRPFTAFIPFAISTTRAPFQQRLKGF